MPSGSEMSDLDDEFSEDEIDLDIWNTNVINIGENEEEDIESNHNDDDLEGWNNGTNEGQEGDDGGEEQNDNDEGELVGKEDDEKK